MGGVGWGWGCEENIARSNVPNFENEVCPTLAILTMVVAVVDITYSTESSWATGAFRRVYTLMSISTSVV